MRVIPKPNTSKTKSSTCEYCKNETYILFTTTLEGENDFYEIDLCGNCHEYFTEDYFEREQIDELIN